MPATRSAFRKMRLRRNIFAESRSKVLSHSMASSRPKELSNSDSDRWPLGVELAEVTSSANLERWLQWFYDAKYIGIYIAFHNTNNKQSSHHVFGPHCKFLKVFYYNYLFIYFFQSKKTFLGISKCWCLMRKICY